MADLQISGSGAFPRAPVGSLPRSSPGNFAKSQIGEAPPSVPDYQMLRRIGGGAYGEVWLARNVLGQFRAVKLIYRHRFTDPRPFEREFEGIRRFEPISRSHPSQLAILHVGKNDPEGCFYYVMELADDAEAQRKTRGAGLVYASREQLPQNYTPHTLRWDIEQRGRLPVSECVEISISLAKALAHLHEQGLVHRDIKPSNVVFVKGVPKLGDIGLVTEVGDTQSIVGTEGYIPPEGPGTVQADIFSLGKVLYEISTGMDRRRFAELPEDLREWPERNAVIEFNEILLRACAREPSQRYQQAEEMRKDLEFLSAGGSVRSSRQRERMCRNGRRVAGGLLAVALLAGLLTMTGRVRRPATALPHERRSTNEVANGFYDVGQHYFDKTTGKDFHTAAAYFEKAVKADPRFAQAYASLALSYIWTEQSGGDLPQAKEAALKALKLDDSLPEPYVALAWYEIIIQWDWASAEKHLRRALALDPSRAVFHHFYAEFLRMSGRTSEALRAMEEARNCDQRSVSINMRWVDHLIAARQYENAIQAADHFIEMEPNIASAPFEFKVRALCALGRYPEAIEMERHYWELQGRPTNQATANAQKLRQAFDTEGTNGYWRVQLEFAEARKLPPYWLARVYAQTGDKENALQCLQAASEAREWGLTFYVMTDWTLDPVRSDPRFEEILKAMHLK